MEGSGGIIATNLTAPINSTNTTIYVGGVNGYPPGGVGGADWTLRVIVIGSEKMIYTNTATAPPRFTGVARGALGTSAASHSNGAKVYTEEASTSNNALGFNIAATADAMGLWAAVTIPFNFLRYTIPHIILLNWSFLTSDLAIIGYFFYAAGAGLVVTLGLYLAGGRRI